MTLYKRKFPDKPLKNVDDPDAYEIRLIDDDENYYTPYYEIAA